MLSTIFTKLQKLKHIVIFEVSSLFQKYTMLIEKRGIQDSEKKNNFVSQNTAKKNQGARYYFYKIIVFIENLISDLIVCYIFNCYFFFWFFSFQCSILSLSQDDAFFLCFLSCIFFWIFLYMKMKNSKMKKSYTAEKMQKSTSSFKNVQSKCEQVKRC